MWRKKDGLVTIGSLDVDVDPHLDAAEHFLLVHLHLGLKPIERRTGPRVAMKSESGTATARPRGTGKPGPEVEQFFN